ncbi:hypothetical protein J437_LFUL013535 [Ladona fulva]|uniref:VWFD domain-containing protein n=1 Tax=Ladona fulva TaxID=123851 RepID=A0A8K0P2Y5_LADFU|nr:hypothetical protein J437_LFUL013535 [Ladona fulva]
MQGVKKAIHDVLFAFGRDGEKVTHLQKLLSKYKIDDIMEQDEPLHVELILQYQDQAVMTYYYNETNIMELVGVIQKTGMGENDFHINYQRLMFPMMNDFTAPTDLGLPMSFKTQTPFFFSLRGNFTAEIMDQKTTRENQIDVKYWRQSEHFFSIYNPFSSLWQGISRTHTVLVHIPLNFYLSADLATRNFKFSLSGNHLTIPGIGVHAGSVVYAKPSLSYGKDDEHTLSLSCPSCSSYTPIKGEQYREKLEYENIEIGELNMNYVFRYFDCDVYDIPFMLEDATDYFEINMNDRFSDGSFLLTVFQLYDAMMRLPFYGRCGFVAKITPGIESAVNNLSGTIQLTTDDFKNKAKVIAAEPHKERYMIKGSITQEKPPVDPLKQREPKYEAVDGSIYTVIGLAGQNTKCPKDGVVFKVGFRATPVPDISKECYRSCAEDAESPEWTHSTTLMPYTPACLEAAIDSTELRRIEIKYEASQFLADIVDKSLYAFYIERGSDPWGDYVVGTNFTENEYPIIKDDRGYVFQLVPSNGFLIVDTVEDEDVDRKILDYGLSSDFNSRFEDYMIVADEEDFFASCVLSPHLTLTLDGTQISDKLSSCYSLAVGHCRSTNPHFAIMVRNIEEINSMALKIYSFKNYLEIIPSSNNSVEMIVNGEHVNFDSENGYEFVSGPSSFRVWQRTHKKEKNAPFYAQIISQPVEISVDYGVDRVIIKLSAIYSGDLCGLCGDYNRPQNHHKWNTCEK